MKKLIALLVLAFAAHADTSIPISQLPLAAGSGIHANDTFPFTDTAAANATKKLKISDLVNVPAIANYFAPLSNPTFTGTVTATTFSGSLVGNVSGNVTGNLLGNATTATALAANPTDCSANQFANAIAANGNLTCAQLLFTDISGTLAINKGGTGATTKVGAFDALSPMSASGDIIYGAASGTGTRLAKGTDGQVLELVSGLPAWTTLSGTGTITQIDTGLGLTGGPITTTGTLALNTSGVTAGTYGSASVVPTIVVDATGRATAATTNAYQNGSYSVKGVLQGDTDVATSGLSISAGVVKLATTGVTAGTYGNASSKTLTAVVDSFGRLTSLSDQSILLNAAAITGGTLDVAVGGTGSVSNTIHGILLGQAGGPITAIVGTNGQIPTGQTGADPIYKTMSGDATYAASGALALATTGVTAGTYGDSTNVPQIVIDAKGRVTSASNVSIPAGGTVTQVNTGTGLTGGPITTTGSISIATTGVTAGTYGTTALVPALVINAQGQVTSASSAAYQNGSYSVKGVLQADTDAATSGLNLASGVIKLATSGVTAGTYGTAARSATVVLDAFGRATSASDAAISIPASAISSGTLPVTVGGTGSVSNTNHGVMLGQGVSAMATTAAGTNGQLFIGQTTADPLFQTVSGDATMAASGALTLATTAVTAGTYGTASAVSTVIVDAKGRVTGASNTTIAIPASAVTSGTLSVARGGTNSASFTAGSVVFAGASGTSLTEDNTSFFYNSSNHRLGIGTNTPASDLEIKRSSAGNVQFNIINSNSAASANSVLEVINDVGSGFVVDVASSTSGSSYPVSLGSGYNMQIQAPGMDINSFTTNVTFNTGTAGYFTPLGDIALGAGVVTSGTAGYAYMPTCAGTCSGTPVGHAGYAPMAIDTTNNKIYFYTSGAWQTPSGGGGGGVTSVATGTGLTGGPITTTGTVSIATTGVTAGTYGSTTVVPQIVVNAQGQITSESDQTIALPVSAITSGTFGVARGGTGASTLTNHGVLLGQTTSPIVATAVGTNGQIFTGQTTADPSFQTMTGDATFSNAGALALATTGVAAGTYGDSTHVGQFVVDAKGRLTTATSVALSGGGTVTSVVAGTGLAGGTITTAGTLSIATSGVTAGTYGTATSVATVVLNALGQATTASNTTIALNGSQVSGGTMSNVAKININTASPTAAATLVVNGDAINNTAINDGSGTTIDFSTGNKHYTSATCGSMTISNLKDGGSYELVVTSTSVGTCAFTTTGFTQRKLGNALAATTSGKQTIFLFEAIGTSVWISQASEN